MNIAEIKDVEKFINLSTTISNASKNIFCKYNCSLNFWLIKFLFFIRGFFLIFGTKLQELRFLYRVNFPKRNVPDCFDVIVVASI